MKTIVTNEGGDTASTDSFYPIQKKEKKIDVKIHGKYWGTHF